MNSHAAAESDSAGPSHNASRYVNLDQNATTPLDPRVLEAIAEVWRQDVGNPSSQHAAGRRARRLLEEARLQIAELLGARTAGRDADVVLFTSGGTESNQLVIRGLFPPPASHDPPRSELPQGKFETMDLLVSAGEHPSVLGAAEAVAESGYAVGRIPLDLNGVVDLAALDRQLGPSTKLVSLQLANHETGVVQPVAEAATRCHSLGVPLHTDAAQGVGKVPVSFQALGVDALTVAPHKFHGPVGIGVLILRPTLPVRPLFRGGFQQGGLRPGTESVALAVGAGRALQLATAELTDRRRHLLECRQRFEAGLLHTLPNLVIHGTAVERLPHTSNVAFVGIDRQALLMALDLAGVACSTGSACASGSSETSPVLRAMGAAAHLLESSLRFSFSKMTTLAEVDESVRRISRIVNELRQRSQMKLSSAAPPKRASFPL